MEPFMEYIKPELLVLVPMLNLLGLGLKKASFAADKHIPIALGGAGIVMALIWVLATMPAFGMQNVLLAVFTAVVQGVLCAGAAVFANQVWRQEQKGSA